jgi:Macrocin-O-methyltransferase (TylF)
VVWNRWRKRPAAAPAPGVEGVRPALSIPLESPYLETRYGFDEEEEIKRAVEVVSRYTMASLERLAQLWQHVRYLDRYGLEGCLVECGTWRGGA